MCGIFGQINNEPSTFNRIIFNTLGIANDTRGGDSCGIFIDGESEYGVDKNKLYEDFFLSSYLLKNIKQCRIAFGHCRKTSVGKTSLETAQPVVIKENNEVKFVLMHNGTIYNYEKLAKKYIPDVDIKGMTDSQVMARIFYYKGYDALSEYNGGAVFMIADYREDPDNPKVLVWKGESKQSKYQTTVFEERPFYYIKTKFGIIFSSIACYLEGFIHNTCWTIKSNCLIEISNGDLFIVKEYSRKNAQQIKELDSYKSETKPNNTQYSTYYIYNNKYGDYMLKGNKIHGKKFCSAYGTCSDDVYNSNQAQFFWFYNGLLLYNEECFNTIELIRKEMSKYYKECESVELFCEAYPEIPSSFSFNPIKIYEQDEYFIVTEDLMWERFTGEVVDVLTNNNCKKIIDGKVDSSTHITSIDSFNRFVSKSKSFSFDKQSFINLINSNYNVSIRL